MKQSVILYLCTAVVIMPGLFFSGSAWSHAQSTAGLSAASCSIGRRSCAAALFDFVYVVGIVVFAVRPAVQSGELARALAYRVLFGFMAYATYDLTNLATFRWLQSGDRIHRPRWGTFLTAISAGGG